MFGQHLITLLLIIMNNSVSFSTQIPNPTIKLEIICIQVDQRTDCFANGTSFPLHDVFVKFGNNTYIFGEDDETSIRYAGFSCTAPYPVMWTHTQEKWLNSITHNWHPFLRDVWLTYKRPLVQYKGDDSYKDLKDTKAYPHSALMLLSNLISVGREFTYATGEYVCSSADPKLPFQTSQKIAVFQDKLLAEKIFPLAGKNVTVWSKDRNPSSTIVFPCHVTTLDVKVALLKKVVRKQIFPNLPSTRLGFDHLIHPHQTNQSNVSHTSWEPSKTEAYLKFSPALGFVMVDNDADKVAPGTYKCVIAGNDTEVADNEYVIVEYKRGQPPSNPVGVGGDNMILPGASYSDKFVQNGTRKYLEIKCCSNSTNPPELYLVSCFSKPMCDRQRRLIDYFDKGEKKGTTRYTTTHDNCQNFNFPFYDHIYIVPINGRCVGDGISFGQMYISAFTNNSRIYHDWSEVEPGSMMKIKRVPTEYDKSHGRPVDSLATNQTVYTGETVTIECDTSMAYFAMDSQFMVHFANGTYNRVKDMGFVNGIDDTWRMGISRRSANVEVTKELKSVSCHAAIIDSQEKWSQKSIEFHVREGLKPLVIKGSQEKEIYWTLGETNVKLTCEFSGAPMPLESQWLKDNRTLFIRKSIPPSHTNITTPQVNTSNLVVDKVTYDSHGEFSCVVENVFGIDRKTFKVFVRASESKWIFISSSLGVTFFVGVALFLTFKRWTKPQNLGSFYGRMF